MKRWPVSVRQGRARASAVTFLYLLPNPAAAHDAFGDLGPFYSSFLHPLADPLQASLLIGIAAFVAQQSLAFARIALPLFLAGAALAAGASLAALPLTLSPLIAALMAVVAGLAAMVPGVVRPKALAFVLVGAAGGATGLAPGALEGADALQVLLGTFGGIAVLALLAWYGLDAMTRHLSPLAPKVAGSWVAAVGILVAAFAV